MPNNIPNNLQGSRSGSPRTLGGNDAAPPPAQAPAQSAADASERSPPPPTRNAAMQAALVAAFADRQGARGAGAPARGAAAQAASPLAGQAALGGRDGADAHGQGSSRSALSGTRLANPLLDSGRAESLEQDQLALLSQDQLSAYWERWAAEGTPTERRSVAVGRMQEWLQGSPDVELTLDTLGLRSLPRHLPPDLQALDISYNLLPGFPEQLPGTLLSIRCTHIGADFGRITSLPAGLRDLVFSARGLECLPENLPAGLRELYVSANGLMSLPENLPAGLRLLHVSANALISLPGNLPAGLRELVANDNQLMSLPGNLPEGLQELSVIDNELTSLPESLPAGLLKLHVNGNELTSLPAHFPASLRVLNLASNRLTTLPESIFALSEDCHVDLRSNPLTDATRNQLRERIARNDYQGPRIVFAIPSAAQPMPKRTLQDAVAAWLSPPGAGAAQRARQWQGFASEPGATAFSRFLDRLDNTVNANNPQFRQSIGEWLLQLENRPALRQNTFQVSEGATASCEDRVSHTLNAMRQLRLADDVEQGHYDQRLPELLTLGRGMFRLDQLELIAHEKAAALPGVDEIEVYLAYQVRLREALALPLDVADMRFFNVSHVTQADLDAAVGRVRQAEQQGFADFLATRWQPWQSVLNRLEPQAYKAAKEELNEAMDEPFANLLHARLRGMGLENDSDAQRDVGPQVLVEIEREIMGQLTQHFLGRHGLQIHPPVP